MSDSTANVAVPGYRWGFDLLRNAVGDKDSYDGRDFIAAGLPMIVACTGCAMTMTGASAFIDTDSYVWCHDCAEQRGA
jgi:hypothetical protein